MQYNQCPIGNYEIEVKAPEERNCTKMFKKLQNNKKETNGICFDSNTECFKQDHLDIFKGVK